MTEVPAVIPKAAAQGTEHSARLRVTELHISFGSGSVLSDASLSLLPGEVVLLIGENGTGKSSLLRAISGQIAPDRGRIELDGQRIDGLAPHEIQAMGIGFVLQGGRVFGSLSVEDNLRVAAQRGLNGGEDNWFALFPQLQTIAHRRAALLSGGERHMLAMAMTFVQAPRVLLLDEPTAGIAPDLALRCLKAVADGAHASRTSVLLVEQNIEAALAVADRAMALEKGILIPYSGNDRCSRERRET